MTKQEQRSLITRFASSQLKSTTIAVLREMVTCNWHPTGVFNDEPDVEAHSFRVSRAKLAARAGLRDTKAVSRSIAILADKNLLTVIREVGKTDQYRLHLGVMETWESAAEVKKARGQARRERRAESARAKRAAAKLLDEKRATSKLLDEFKWPDFTH